MVRFNDLMQTVLAADDRAGLGAVTLWRQCVDLLAQHDRADRMPMAADQRAALLDRLSGLRSKMSETQRIATVVELGSRLRSASLVEFFAHDRPSIAAAAMARAQLPDMVWDDLLPRLTPTARGVLRGRRDIGPATRLALEAFGPSDLVLTTVRDDMVGDSDMLLTADMIPANDVQEPEVEAGTVTPLRAPLGDKDQIRNLVDRIAQFTSTRSPPQPLEPLADEPADRSAPPRDFAFETDAAGVILWIDRGPRAALIGLSLGDAALEGGSGPDGHVAGAFARRSGFQNGRFAIVGGKMAGEWRLSAAPFFDPRSGRFQGYRGQARRPFLHEVAVQPAPPRDGLSGLSADSLRQLVHELRTPLNAILGFAEIIEQELFGPAGAEYRDMAGNIAVDARHLLAAFDDLDLAARVSRGDDVSTPQLLDPELLVRQIASRFRDQGGALVDIAMAASLPPVQIDPVQGERMVQHLLRTLISVAPKGEAVTGACWFQPDGGNGRVVLAIDRPSSLAGMEEAQLLDPGYTSDGDWADGPLLGLGFSLRLIRSLAGTCGGSLDVEPGRLLLAIPAASIAEDTQHA
ncbi:MAG: sensor histidine kinase [Pseudomonadota bacterium]|uniref:histidine kinase n=1 Tax=Sphingobium xenophagum TaxID=121428 RepID=A0A249MVG6_SPHXE|nr:MULTISPECIES: HAMP domain-containing sensor histidine kinase [Sphingobium]ASY45147.1 sensor histidine kinase [Sphingobium xenophagum]OUC54332.1 sensor histidine kinase [Sphingobium sp. GW456-12-10-14-TSB1]QWT14503.1 HAMP domain-containing histidine kinase [Sphingobium xenophagum]